MKIKFPIASVCFALTTCLTAQTSLNLLMNQKVKDCESKKITTSIDVLIQGDIDKIKHVVETVGGHFKFSNGNIASVNLPIIKLNEVVANKGVERIEAFSEKMKQLNDTMLIHNNVIPVHNGQAPLTQAYDGTGVVIGFIDTGINFSHPDFKDNTGHSRVKYLWDQSLPNAANTPLPYGYGQEFTNTTIDAGMASASNDIAAAGHGTHTAGIAAGNGLATGNFKGVAPKADIIMVGSAYGVNVVDGVNYIFTKALAMGKPCVINASYGTNQGSHDGYDLMGQFIYGIINAHNGRAFVAAAGNDGDPYYPIHLGYNVTSDTNFTLYANTGTSIYMAIYADAADITGINFSVGADQMLPSHSFRGRTPFSTVAAHLGSIDYDTLYKNGNRIGIIQMLASTYTGPSGLAYQMEFLVIPDSVNYNWRLITTGSGKFDMWMKWDEAVLGTLPSVTTMPDSAFYKQPDNNKSICSSFQCLDNVVTVGGYISRRTMLNYDNLIYDSGAPVGVHTSYSAIGPTRDGRTKPDISAPENYIVSAIVPALINLYYIPNGIEYIVAHDSMHVAGSGTSAASPSVAGIAALYLQLNPTATAYQVKNAITSCATQDAFTGSSLPDNTWGYGKANAFAALTACGVGIDGSDKTQNVFEVFPNPNSSSNSIHIYTSEINGKVKSEVIIYNILSEVVKKVTLTTHETIVNNELPGGMYFCYLLVDGKKVAAQKIIITK